MNVPVFRPTIRRRDMDSVLTCLVSDDVGPGTLAESLAHEIASYIGADAGVCLRDYAHAAQVALMALDLPDGAKVALSPIAPDVYRIVLDELGFHPVFPDVDPLSGCMNIEDLARIARDGASAIILHYTLGIIPNVDDIMALGLPIMEDISQAIGGTTTEHRVGTYGRFGVMSLEPDEVVTSGGGAVVFPTSRKDRPAFRKIVDSIPRERIMPNMNAALALQQLRRIESFIAKRKEIASIFQRAVLRGRHKMLVQPGEAENVYSTFPVLLSGGTRDVIQYCARKQIEVRRAFERSIIASFQRESPSVVEITESAPDPSEQLSVDSGGGPESNPPGAVVDPTGPENRPATASAPDGGDAYTRSEPAGAIATAAMDSAAVYELPGANALLMRCVLFPLYPALPRRDVERLEKILVTLP